MVDIPHLKWPVQFANGQALVVEQDSIDDVLQCCKVVLSYPKGFAVELPEFGTPDQAFHQGSADVGEINAALDRWEPRARQLIDEHPDLLDPLIDHVEIHVRGEAGGSIQ